jgi:hypothetical protein
MSGRGKGGKGLGELLFDLQHLNYNLPSHTTQYEFTVIHLVRESSQ